MEKSEKFPKRVLAIGDGLGLPDGYASTSRMKYLCSSLKRYFMSVDVLISRPSDFHGRALNASRKGCFNGIGFQYANASPVYSKYSILRRLQSQFGIFSTVFKVLLEGTKGDLVVFAYVRNIQLLALLFLVTRMVRSRLYLELCEWPEALPAKSWHERLMNNLFSKYCFGLVDGVVCISDYIGKRAQDRCPGIPILNIPILADVGEFDGVAAARDEAPYVMYCGNLTYQETLEFVLQAFSKVVGQGVKHNLLIAGSSWSGDFQRRFEALVQEKGLQGRVRLLGYISRESLLSYYMGAAALLIPLFDDIVSAARFPTKISEYLLSGVPVVTTCVGEVGKIIKDGDNGFVSKPNDVSDYAFAIGRAIGCAGRGEVGEKGRELALAMFDYQAYGERLARFIGGN